MVLTTFFNLSFGIVHKSRVSVSTTEVSTVRPVQRLQNLDLCLSQACVIRHKYYWRWSPTDPSWLVANMGLSDRLATSLCVTLVLVLYLYLIIKNKNKTSAFCLFVNCPLSEQGLTKYQLSCDRQRGKGELDKCSFSITASAELRKAASALAERLEIPQEHSSLETSHNLHGFPGTEYINIKTSFFAADMELTIELWKSASTLDIPRNRNLATLRTEQIIF